METPFFICEICGASIPRSGNNQKYCPACGAKRRKEKNKEYMRRFEQNNPEYNKNWYRWYRRYLKGEDD